MSEHMTASQIVAMLHDEAKKHSDASDDTRGEESRIHHAISEALTALADRAVPARKDVNVAVGGAGAVGKSHG